MGRSQLDAVQASISKIVDALRAAAVPEDEPGGVSEVQLRYRPQELRSVLGMDESGTRWTFQPRSEDAAARQLTLRRSEPDADSPRSLRLGPTAIRIVQTKDEDRVEVHIQPESIQCSESSGVPMSADLPPGWASGTVEVDEAEGGWRLSMVADQVDRWIDERPVVTLTFANGTSAQIELHADALKVFRDFDSDNPTSEFAVPHRQSLSRRERRALQEPFSFDRMRHFAAQQS